MQKMGTLSTAIRIKKKTVTTNENGFEVEAWEDVIQEDILCEWTNKTSKDKAYFLANKVDVMDPALLKLWFIPGVDTSCRVIRLDDNVEFEIFGADDVGERHQQLVLDVMRYVAG